MHKRHVATGMALIFTVLTAMSTVTLAIDDLGNLGLQGQWRIDSTDIPSKRTEPWIKVSVYEQHTHIRLILTKGADRIVEDSLKVTVAEIQGKIEQGYWTKPIKDYQMTRTDDESDPAHGEWVTTITIPRMNEEFCVSARWYMKEESDLQRAGLSIVVAWKAEPGPSVPSSLQPYILPLMILGLIAVAILLIRRRKR